MEKKVAIIGGGLAGSEAALVLAAHGIAVSLYEMRPTKGTPVHATDSLAELVCSNSLKSTKFESAAGMLKAELEMLGSPLYGIALECRVPAGGALALDRYEFSRMVTDRIESDPLIDVIREEVTDIERLAADHDGIIIATGPLTSDALSMSLAKLVGEDFLSFYDAAAPIVMAESLDETKVFSQSRYEEGAEGDYLNVPFSKEEYDAFIENLVNADRVIAKDFESKDLFQACQPIEEIAKSGHDAPRFGPMKPVGLVDPRTGKRPWAVLQLRKEDNNAQSYNLVGFQTNLTFPEQKRVFAMMPGFEHAEFARLGVMHRNTYIDAPTIIDPHGKLKVGSSLDSKVPIYIAGQLSGTEGYCEAIRSGMNCAISMIFDLAGIEKVSLPEETAFGSLMIHATSSQKGKYQPMHVNFGIFKPLDAPVKKKGERYRAYAQRGWDAMVSYCDELTLKSGGELSFALENADADER